MRGCGGNDGLVAIGHGHFWENQPEAIEVCLHCRRPDCSNDGCPELRAVVERLRAEYGDGRHAGRGLRVYVAGETRSLDGWAERLGVTADWLCEAIREGREPEEVVWRIMRARGLD